MGQFKVRAKRYPDGASLDAYFLTFDADFTAPAHPLAVAQAYLYIGGATPTVQFLYWDTGRHITSKRRVQFHFNHPDNWDSWTATAWFGIPPTGPDGTPRKTAITKSHWIGHDLMTPTPINGLTSTFTNGPQGQAAWPWMGDDHVARTEWGPTNLGARLDTHPYSGGPDLQFREWLQLVWGGDPSGEFEENDDELVPASGGGPTTLSHGNPQLAIAEDASVDLIASYIQPTTSTRPPINIRDRYRVPERIPGGIDRWWPPYADPAPEDWRRLEQLRALLDRVREPAGQTDIFTDIATRAGEMSSRERRLAVTQIRAALRRGEATLERLMQPLREEGFEQVKTARHGDLALEGFETEEER